MSTDEGQAKPAKGSDALPSDKPAGTLEAPKPSKSREAELLAALDVERAKTADHLARLMYLQADFDNYRKRVQRELEDARLLGTQNLLVPLLTIVDELELALRSAERSGQADAIRDGVGMVLKKLLELLAQEGVERIPAQGQPYDPAKHEVIGREVSPEHRDGEIIEEVRAGYTWRGNVLRPSVVRIAGKPQEASATSSPSSPGTAAEQTTTSERTDGIGEGDNGESPL